MKKVREIKAHHILSEPGDVTRYDYFCIREEDVFWFMPRDSTFAFPGELRFWEIKDLYTDDLAHEPDLEKRDRIKIMAEEMKCNPFTLAECIRTAHEARKAREMGGHENE